MEHQKILNLVNEASDSKFVTRKWNIVNDQSNANYDAGNETICNIEVLKSNPCDYNDSYIATQVSFKNCTTFTKCITKLIQFKLFPNKRKFIVLF